ncbi:MAG: copper resistance protein CopC [Caldilineaceae bacterium]
MTHKIHRVKRYWGHWLIAGLFATLLAQPAGAHAVLARSSPGLNAALTQAPSDIRLWFTEPVEPKFSSFQLRDINGATVKTPTSQVDSADPKQLVMQPGTLTNGLYTVVWSVVSAADGHHTDGSFAFTIGPAVTSQTAAKSAAPFISPSDTIVRWFNLLALALAVGSIGFACFVWQPAATETSPLVERRVDAIIWSGWVLLGLSGGLLLLLQTAAMTNVTLFKAVTQPALFQVVQSTRFGKLWSARMELWLIMGGVLFLAQQFRQLRWLALIFGSVILLLNSLYSHAAATQDAVVAILSDWLHLTMAALWIGGLVQFFGIIGLVRRTVISATAVLDRFVGYFSNYARIAVAGLAVTGLYAAWLQVGTLAGLRTTLYGQALLAKLLLLLPLLVIAGVNLIWTHRRLQAGQAVWVGRLRGLVGAELVLALGVLGAVGVMTSISPARTELTQQTIAKALAAAPAARPIMDMQEADTMQVHLMIEPGWVGVNKFTVILSTPDGLPVADASLIRLRFQSQAQALGESEMRITEHQGNVYRVSGANLSVPGDWQIRMTIQRPDQFDTVVDFTPQVPLAPPPPAAPLIDTSAPLPYRQPFLLLTGILALGLGGYFIGQNRFRFWQGASMLAAALVLFGGLCLAVAVV